MPMASLARGDDLTDLLLPCFLAPMDPKSDKDVVVLVGCWWTGANPVAVPMRRAAAAVADFMLVAALLWLLAIGYWLWYLYLSGVLFE
mgnify:CR=1 FL=1